MDERGLAPMTAQHILLTGLGNRATETVYQFKGSERTANAPLTPLALLRLLPDDARPNRVLALVTEGARKQQENKKPGEGDRSTWDIFSEDVSNFLGREAEPIYIPDGRSEDEVRQIIEKAAGKFTDDVELTLDVTQGFRHFPFVFYALALYLTSLRRIRLRGAYYGMLEGFPRDSKEPRPIVDLQPLLELPEWFHAVRVFRETGSTGSLASLLEPMAVELRSEARSAGNAPELHQTASSAAKLRDQLQQVAFAYESAMPLELGKVASLLSNSLDELPTTVSSRLPLSNQLAEVIVSALEPLRFSTLPTRKGEWKEKLHVDDEEMTRQARLIEQYFSRDQLPLAIGLLREWVVSWILQRQGNVAHWWSRDERIRAEQRLGALSAALESDLKDTLSEPQGDWAEFWHNLSDVRNTLHHHGMRKQALESAPATVDQIRSFWNRIKVEAVDLPALGGGGGTLLITAIGNRPGVLYSALLTAQPDRVLVLCSERSEPMVDEAASRAEYTQPIKRIVVSDPHGGFDELERVRAEAGEWLLNADRIVANLTGGTTLMGLMVQQLVETGGRLSRPFCRFALIDRRPPGEQDAEPWVQSDHCWIDKPQGETHADD